MTLKYINGFETVVVDSDLRGQGWAGIPAVSRGYMAGRSSFNGLPGTSLRATSPSWIGSTTTLPGIGTAGTDLGMYNTGITSKQAWDAGGFSVGGYMRFNEANLWSPYSDQYICPMSLAATGTVTYGGFNQVAHDGTNLYAVRAAAQNNAWRPIPAPPSFKISKSIDGGVTWTDLPNPPSPFTPTIGMVITCPAPGTVWVGTAASTAATGADYGHWVTTNDGASWTQCTAVASAVAYTQCIATGNPTYPYAFLVTATAATVGIYVSTALTGGAMTKVSGTSANALNAIRLKLIDGYLIALWGGTAAISRVQVSTLPTAGTTVALGTPVSTASNTLWDIAKVGTNWVIAGNGGTYYLPQATANAPAATGWTAMTGSVANIYALQLHTDNVLYGAGAATNTLYSTTDGVTLNVGQSIPPGYGYSWPVFVKRPDGRYVLVMCTNNSTTQNNSGITVQIDNPADLSTGVKFLQVPDFTENTSPGPYSVFGVYLAQAGTFVAESATFTAATNGSTTAMFGVQASTLSGPALPNNRTLSLYSSLTDVVGTSTIEQWTANLTDRTPWHYYEIVAEADPANVNKFFLSLKVDGDTPIRGITSVSLAAVADLTSTIVINLPRAGQWQQFDDVYFADFTSGQPNRGAIGPIQIMRRRAATDVQAQWTKVGDAASNALSVNKDSINSTTNANYVQTTTTGAKDIYGNANPSGMPSVAGYNVRAVQVSTYMSRNSSTIPEVQLGVVSNSVVAEAAAQQVGPNTPRQYTAIFQQNPDGNVNWTPTTALATQTSIKKSN